MDRRTMLKSSAAVAAAASLPALAMASAINRSSSLFKRTLRRRCSVAPTTFRSVRRKDRPRLERQISKRPRGAHPLPHPRVRDRSLALGASRRGGGRQRRLETRRYTSPSTDGQSPVASPTKHDDFAKCPESGIAASEIEEAREVRFSRVERCRYLPGAHGAAFATHLAREPEKGRWRAEVPAHG